MGSLAWRSERLGNSRVVDGRKVVVRANEVRNSAITIRKSTGKEMNSPTECAST
jgi:hypothetical protein